MPQTKANGLSLEYEILGSPSDPPVLLIMGLGMQLTRWPVPMCEQLVAHGYRVIRFDNRDVGRSTWLTEVPTPDLFGLIQAMTAGQAPQVPYTLTDMAADVIGLLDALQIEAAHIVGASMGGMIAQMVAAFHPQRTWTLTSLMSTSGNPELPRPAPAVMARIMVRPPEDSDLEGLIEHGIETVRVMASPSYSFDTEQTRIRVQADLARGHNPNGVTRQIAAITATGDRRSQLAAIRAPTLVLHGEDDPLFPAAAADELAACIKGARLRVIPGMGHELPDHLHTTLVAAIVGNLRRGVRC